MTQRTLVLTVPADERDALRRSLERGTFEHRSVPHALFSVKGEGVVATLYASGKLVVQGADPELFAERFLGRSPTPPSSGSGTDAGASGLAALPVIGSDEAGKGDFLGPLVVAAVRVDPDEARELARSRVADSKRLADETVLRLGAALRSRYEHAVVRLDPPEYNRLYGRARGLNELLADQHARVIGELARGGDRVVVDQFANERLLIERTRELGVALEQRPRAEELPVVAAASVLAREGFLLGLRELSEAVGVDLRKGAGPPADEAGAAVVRLHGEAGLERVAKLHFKNVEKVKALL